MLNFPDWQTYGEYLLPGGDQNTPPTIAALREVAGSLHLDAPALDRLQTAVCSSLDSLRTVEPVVLRIRVRQKTESELAARLGLQNWGFFIVEKSTGGEGPNPALPHHVFEVCLYAE